MTPSPPEKQAPDLDGPSRGLTIGELAGRTGLSPATLRMWETRYGFPRAERLPSGHRRYPAHTVDLVRQVQRRRDAGARLESAVSAVADPGPTVPSVFADLRARHPDLQPQTLRKATLLALSWAIEDECCARAQQPWLFGAFQEERYYRQAHARWRDLARTARACWVLAGFPPGPSPAGSRAGVPVEVAVPADSHLTREWSVVCLAPDFPAALAAWELPGQHDVLQHDRLFEAVWTLEPAMVADAARSCARLVAQHGGGNPGDTAGDTPADTAAVLADADRFGGYPGDLRHATSVFSRALGYLEAVGRGPS